MQDPSNSQRALFTFLGHALLAPFFAGVFVLASMILARPLKLEGLIPSGLPNAGEAALTTFVWSALPAALAGLALALIVWRRRGYPWISAVAAGGIAFMLVAVVIPPAIQLPLTPLTAVAAFIAIVVRASLLGGGIITKG